MSQSQLSTAASPARVAETPAEPGYAAAAASSGRCGSCPPPSAGPAAGSSPSSACPAGGGARRPADDEHRAGVGIYQLKDLQGQSGDAHRPAGAAHPGRRRPALAAQPGRQAQQLGMVPAKSMAFIRLSDGSIIGVAQPAKDDQRLNVVTAPVAPPPAPPAPAPDPAATTPAPAAPTPPRADMNPCDTEAPGTSSANARTRSHDAARKPSSAVKPAAAGTATPAARVAAAPSSRTRTAASGSCSSPACSSSPSSPPSCCGSRPSTPPPSGGGVRQARRHRRAARAARPDPRPQRRRPRLQRRAEDRSTPTRRCCRPTAARSTARHVVGVVGAAQQLAPLLGTTPDALYRADGQPVPHHRQGRHADRLAPDQPLGIPGIYSEPSTSRVYPAGMTPAPLVGFVQKDGTAGGGVEVMADSALKGTRSSSSTSAPRTGRRSPAPSRSTSRRRTARRHAHHRLRYPVVRTEPDRQHGDRGPGPVGHVVVQELKTGKLRAAACYPTFDPDDLANGPHALGNHAFQDVFEPGSTGKLMTMAAALEHGVVQPTTRSSSRTGCPGRG